MSSPTAEQIEALLDFLNEHRDLARGSLRSVEGRARSHRLWEELCTTLNAMGGCTKTTKQWQKVWTDKKYMAKKSAAAARRSAAATGGGPSTAPQLSQWELRVISIMGERFGEPQLTTRAPAFDEQVRNEPPADSLETTQERDLIHDPLLLEPSGEETAERPADPPIPGQSGTAPVRHSTHSRRPRQLRGDGSVRDRLFQVEDHRAEREERTINELAGIRVALLELCSLIRQFLER